MNRRAFATLLVLWILAIAVIVIVAVQSAAFTQAASGRESLARVRAKWAARAGVEAMIARIEDDTANGKETDAFTIINDCAASGSGTLMDAAYRVGHDSPTGFTLGVADAHAKLNINGMTADQLALIPDMPEDGPDCILDWIDSDDDTRPMGAESNYYRGKTYWYECRNAPMRNIAELELVMGFTREQVRGEDLNLNGVLDPEEDTGDSSSSVSNADGKLDAGWSGLMTTASVDGGLALSGQARLDLATAKASDVATRISCDSAQAAIIVAYGARSNAVMGDFIRRNLAQLANTAGVQNAQGTPALTRDQLRLLFNECGIKLTSGVKPGKLNINTCEATTLQYLPQISAALADSIILERSSRPQGFESVVDLLDVPAMSRQSLSQISNILDVRSNVYVATSRGRDALTGIEVEVVATIDRSTVPVTITEYRTR